tara:strand:- start:901 stop:1230 length:330 start_codon:yes stop_codon:yes gene_type:complete
MMGMYREAIRKRFREVRKIMEKKMEGKQPKYLSGSKKEDMVNNPPHYNKNGIETIDAIRAMTDDGYEYYLQGNIMKYLWRYRYKNGVEDLKKAQWYLNELIDELEKDES